MMAPLIINVLTFSQSLTNDWIKNKENRFLSFIFSSLSYSAECFHYKIPSVSRCFSNRKQNMPTLLQSQLFKGPKSA